MLYIYRSIHFCFLPLDEAIASKSVSGSDRRKRFWSQLSLQMQIAHQLVNFLVEVFVCALSAMHIFKTLSIIDCRLCYCIDLLKRLSLSDNSVLQLYWFSWPAYCCIINSVLIDISLYYFVINIICFYAIKMGYIRHA